MTTFMRQLRAFADSFLLTILVSHSRFHMMNRCLTPPFSVGHQLFNEDPPEQPGDGV